MEKRIPRRRFKEFVGSGEWEEKKLGEILRTDSFRSYIKKPQFNGEHIVIQQGNDPVAGYADGDPYLDYEKVVLFGDHTLSLYKPKVPFFISTDGLKIIYGSNNMDSNFILYTLELYKPKNEGYKRYYSILKDKEVYISKNLAEQEKIGNFFQKLDRLIDINREKLGKLKASKSAYLTEMFPREGEDRPRRRFQGFTGPWEENKFEDIFEVSQGLQIAINKRFTSPGKNRFFYITNEILKDDSKSKYYIYNPPKNVVCRKNDILMTRTGNTGIIVTNVEGCFHNNFFKIKYDYSYLNKDFICELLSSTNVQKKILNSAGNSTIPDLSHRSFYNLSAKFPSLAEQEKIGDFFKKLDQQIGVQEEKLEKLERMKKAYLAEIFV